MGFNRFKSIHSSLVFDIAKLLEFFDLLRTSFQKYWTPGSIVCFDESVYAYKPRKSTKEKSEKKGDPIPSVYIPRKPHPNGLLNWCLVTVSSTTGLPFVIDFEPHLSFPTISGQNAILKMHQRWPYPFKPCYVADATIGSFELLQEMHSSNSFACFSISKKVKPWLWQLLSTGTPDKHWKAAWTKEGLLASMFCGEVDHKTKKKTTK